MSRRQIILFALSLAVLIFALAGPLFAPYDIDELQNMPYAWPQQGGWLGTDYLGADVLSRLLSGGCRLVLFALITVFIAWLCAAGLGMLAALRGGMLDRVLLRLTTILLSVPGLLLLTMVIAITGPGYVGAATAVLLVLLPDIFRLVRAATLQELQQDYIDVARCRGDSEFSLLWREVAPNLLSLFATDMGIRLPTAIFILATASFLGLGAMPPQADWGLMIMENRQGLQLQPWATLAPVIAIMLLLIPLNLLLDSVFRPPIRRTRNCKTAGYSAVKVDSRDVLAVEGLTLQREGVNALESIDFRLRQGEVVALTGASGSGKSTLINALLGELSHDTDSLSGEIWLFGEAISCMSRRALRQLRQRYIGYLPQDPRMALLPSQRIGRYLALMAKHRGLHQSEAKQQIFGHFEQLGLPASRAFLRRYPHQLSGGQRQRVMAVAVLLGYPPLLMLDEPTSALDAYHTKTLLNWITGVARQQGMTVLMVAHDLPQACRVASKVMLLDARRLTLFTSQTDFIRQSRRMLEQHLHASCDEEKAINIEGASTQPLLQVRHMNAHYSGAPVLHNIAFRLPSGGCLSIVGHSGSGKTTLLRAVAGLNSNCKGVMEYHDAPLAAGLERRQMRQRRTMQYIAQDPASSLNPFYRVRALLMRPLQVYFPQLSREEKRHRIDQAMLQLGLPPALAERRARQLSGGQRQRVALARALLAQPDMLICDEVTSALDEAGKQQLVGLLRQLRTEQNMALLVVTHDMSVAAQLGGEVLVMDNGKVIESGSVSSVFRSPQQSLTRELLAQLHHGEVC